MNKAEKVEFVKGLLYESGFKVTPEIVSSGIMIMEKMELRELQSFLDGKTEEFKEYGKEISELRKLLDDYFRVKSVVKPNEYYLTTYLKEVRSFWNGNQWQNKPVDCPCYFKEKAIEYSNVLNCSIINVKSFE